MLNVVKLHKDAIIPEKAHDGDAGFDLFALKDMVIRPNETILIPTGIGIEIPYGYYGDVTGKSGLTSKTQLRVQRGIVDFGYQGDIGVIVTNQQTYKWDDRMFDMLLDARYDVQNACELADRLSNVIMNNDVDDVIEIKKGQKIAQILISPCDPDSSVVVHSDFSKTSDRGEGGFGSTGIYQTRESAKLELNTASGMTGTKINNSGIYGIPVPDGMAIGDGDHIPPCNPDSGRLQIEEFKNLQANGFIGG